MNSCLGHLDVHLSTFYGTTGFEPLPKQHKLSSFRLSFQTKLHTHKVVPAITCSWVRPGHQRNQGPHLDWCPLETFLFWYYTNHLDLVINHLEPQLAFNVPSAVQKDVQQPAAIMAAWQRGLQSSLYPINGRDPITVLYVYTRSLYTMHCTL